MSRKLRLVVGIVNATMGGHGGFAPPEEKGFFILKKLQNKQFISIIA